MKIKKATLKDLNTILKFQKLLNEYESKFAKAKISKTKTINALKDKKVAYFIAYTNKIPVGCSEVYLKGKTAVMSGTFVLPKFRKRGVASALFKARKNWAKKQGAGNLILKVYNKNKKAIKLWKKLGYKEKTSRGKLITMKRKLTNL